MKKKGILLALLVLALTLTVAVATAECAHTSWHYEHDQYTHWGICDDCGKTIYREVHRNSCDQLNVCKDCGASDVTFNYTYHVGPTKEEFDQTFHWRVCENCGEKLLYSVEEHYEYCNDLGVCGECGATGVTFSDARHFSTHYEYDQVTHWAVCDYCRKVIWGPFKHYTEAGYPEGICYVCGATYTPIPDPVKLNSITITGSQTVGGSVTATVSATGATYYSYWVYNGQGELVSEAYMTTSSSYSFTPAKPNIYNVFVAVTDGLTTAQDNSGWFPVQGDPVVINDFSVSGDKKPGTYLTVTIHATGATSYSFWLYNANGTLVEEVYMVRANICTFLLPASTPGGYNVFVAATDGVSGAQTNSGWFLVE